MLHECHYAGLLVCVLQLAACSSWLDLHIVQSSFFLLLLLKRNSLSLSVQHILLSISKNTGSAVQFCFFFLIISSTSLYPHILSHSHLKQELHQLTMFIIYCVINLSGHLYLSFSLSLSRISTFTLLCFIWLQVLQAILHDIITYFRIFLSNFEGHDVYRIKC